MEPPQPVLWQYGVALVLGVGLFAACGQLALVANVSKLPKETLDFFGNPDNLNSNLQAPGLDNWDPAPYLLSALPIAVSNVRAGAGAAAAALGGSAAPRCLVPTDAVPGRLACQGGWRAWGALG
jgi:hypothetical protein